MAIGDVKASGGIAVSTVSDNSASITERSVSNFSGVFENLVRAGFNYANSRTQIENIYDDRAQKSEALSLDSRFLDYQRQRGEDYTEFSRQRSDSPVGMTKQYQTKLEENDKAFLATVPPRFQEEYANKLTEDRARRVGSAFSAELSLMDDADSKTLNKSLNTLGSAMKGGSTNLDDAQAEWEVMVGNSGLPESTKRDLIEGGRQTLQGLDFGTIVEDAARGYGAANDGTTGDVAAAGLIPQERGVLNAISSKESPGYNVWNGGTTFSDYSDHPAALGKAPGKSTAAGKYQFILGTWRDASAAYERKYGVKVPDFSPEWQDRVALSHAETIFNRWNGEGLNFRKVLASGDPAQIVKIRRVLGNPKDPRDPNSVEWEGWADRSFGGDAAKADAAFLEVFTGEKGLAGGGSGTAQIPNVWTDPRYQDLSLESKQRFATSAWEAGEQFRLREGRELKKQTEAFNTQAYALGYNGGNLDAITQLQASPMWSVEAEKQFRAGVEAYNKKETSIGQIQSALDSGQPLTARDTEGLKNWFGDEGYNGVVSGDADSYARLRYAATKGRKLPPNLVDSFRATASNPEAQRMALENFAALHAGNPALLAASGFGVKEIADIELFTKIAGATSQEKAYTDFAKIEENVRASGKSAQVLSTEAAKLWSENYDTDKILGMFSSWGARSSPSTAQNPAVVGQVTADFGEAFRTGYMMYGTQDGAEAYATAAINMTWGVTYTRPASDRYFTDYLPSSYAYDPVLMKYPPEKFYTPADGEFVHIYRAADAYANANVPEGTIVRPGSAVLVSDKTTEADIQSGRSPTYTMIAQGEFGEAVVVKGRFGGDSLEEEAKKINTETQDKAASLSEVDATSTMLTAQAGKVVELEAGAFTEEGKVALADARVLLDVARQRREAAETSATERGWLAQNWRESSSELRQFIDSGFDLGLSPPAQGAEAQLNFVRDLMTNTTEGKEFRQRFSSLATSIVREERKEDGKRYSRPEAEQRALGILITKELGVPPEVGNELSLKFFNRGR